MATIQQLAAGDEAALEAFLAPRWASSMFLRANSRAAGIAYTGAPKSGTYVALMENGAIAGVAAHLWNGMVILQAPAHAGALARTAVQASGRRVKGLGGPWAQVVAGRAGLGLAHERANLESKEDLFTLDLARLRVPAALGDAPGPALDAKSRGEIELGQRDARQWLLTRDGAPVAFTAFNATLPDAVQVGGVYTPPEQRRKGYARCAVAGQLLDARAAGAAQAVLFTQVDNAAAIKAYRALGFERVGDYGLVLF